MFDWFRAGQLGCLFAMLLAHQDPPWDSVIEMPPLDDIGDRLTVHLDGIVDSKGEAAQAVFPSVRTPEDVVDLVNALCRNRRWYWYEVPWEKEDGEPTALLIGLRWVLPSGKSVNHVLGFSDQDTMPITRRSPFTTLVLRTSDNKRALPIKTEGEKNIVHLADIDSGLYPQSKHDQAWEATKRLKRNILREHGPLWGAARAKITFAVPFSLRAKLCAESKQVEGS